MDFEFKLFGSLTIKQFGGLALWLVFAFFVYLFKLPPIFAWPIISLLVFLGIAFAFLTVNGLPFPEWLTLFIIAMIKPQRRIWKKTANVPKVLTQEISVPEVDLTTRGKKHIIPDQILNDVLAENSAPSDEEKINSNIDRYLRAEGIPKSMMENMQKQKVLKPQIEKSREALFANTNSNMSNNNVPQQVQSNAPLSETVSGQIKANTIVGRVIDKNGAPCGNATIIVKDSKFIIVRQTISNNTGVFRISTPLPNGAYSISVELKNKIFDENEVVLTGEFEKIITIHEKI